MSSPRFLTLAELRTHPSLPEALEIPTATISGRAPVAKTRGGPVELTYKLYGQGPIKILWNNGHGESMRNWRRQMIDFGLSEPDKYTSCFYSYRNYDDSGKSWSFLSPKEAAEDALDLLDSLGWEGERCVHVVGFSFGGYVAQNIAYLAPKRLASLTLASTTSHVASNFTLSRTASMIYDSIPRGEAHSLEQFKKTLFGPDWVRENDEEGLFPTNGDRVTAQSYLASGPNNTKGALLQVPGAYKHYFPPEKLAKIAAEVGHKRILVLHGSHDQMLLLEHGYKLHNGLGGDDKGVSLIVLPKTGHMTIVEQRQALKNAIVSLIERSEGVAEESSC